MDSRQPVTVGTRLRMRPTAKALLAWLVVLLTFMEKCLMPPLPPRVLSGGPRPHRMLQGSSCSTQHQLRQHPAALCMQPKHHPEALGMQPQAAFNSAQHAAPGGPSPHCIARRARLHRLSATMQHTAKLSPSQVFSTMDS